MKKLLLVAAAGFMIVGMSSCKKDYSCTCTYSNGLAPVTDVTTFVDSKKSAAKALCEGDGIGSIKDSDGDKYPASDESCTLD